MNLASQKLKQLEIKYLASIQNIKHFNTDEMFSATIVSYGQLKKAQALHYKNASKLKQFPYDDARVDDIITDIIQDACQDVPNDLDQNQYLISPFYFNYRLITQADLPLLTFEMKAYLTQSNSWINNFRMLILFSKYSNQQLAKSTHLSPEYFKNLQNSPSVVNELIRNMPLYIALDLHRFFINSKVFDKYEDHTDPGDDKFKAFKNFNDKHTIQRLEKWHAK